MESRADVHSSVQCLGVAVARLYFFGGNNSESLKAAQGQQKAGSKQSKRTIRLLQRHMGAVHWLTVMPLGKIIRKQ